MNSLSIKKRMMIWYAFALIVIVAVSSAALLIIGDDLVRDNAMADLKMATDRTAGKVRIVSGELNIADDIEYYVNGVYVVIYKDDGMQLSGLVMDELTENVDFEADTIREIDQNGNPVYVYDRLIENKKVGRIWIRGMTSADIDVISPGISKILRTFLIAVPILLILALLGGWIITRRVFAPLKEINETAQKIYEGNDLSLRIDAGDTYEYEFGNRNEDDEYKRTSGDEIKQTAGLFNKMLDGIEKNFEAEKRFTNDASHELRTPTAVIRAQSEYALSQMDDPNEVEEALRVILGQSEKMSDLLNKLLMLARADRGAVSVGRELVDLGLTAESAAAHLAAEAEKKDITIEVETEDVNMTGDEALLERAAENLISNAIKYGKQGGHVTVTVSSEESAAQMQERKYAVLTVSDDGIGIAEDQLPHIWERFYRVEGAGDHESMGLGLSLTKWIITEHGGTINAVSEPGKGSTFTVCLPIKS